MGQLMVGVAAVVGGVGAFAGAYYQHRSIVALIEAWKLDRSLDLPVALKAVRPRRFKFWRPGGGSGD